MLRSVSLTGSAVSLASVFGATWVYGLAWTTIEDLFVSNLSRVTLEGVQGT